MRAFALTPMAMMIMLFSSQHVAKDYWHADPCGGQVAIEQRNMSWRYNAVSRYIVDDHIHDCTIYVNSQITWDWQRLCTVMVHEYGHLTGLDDSDDPSIVMYRYYAKPIDECKIWRQ